MIVHGDYRDAFVQFTVLGLAAIVESELDARVRIEWVDQFQASVTSADGASDEEMAAAVKRHAEAHAEGSWVQVTASLGGSQRSPFSPRVGALSETGDWQRWHDVRESEIDTVLADNVLDLRLISALGEPSYWAENPTVSTQVNSGASLWEMKTRNKGEEFVQHRLARLARTVASRTVAGIEAGLLGETIVDEVGKNSGDSRTPTGFRAPGRTDNARAWCALWGISNFPVRPVVSGQGYKPSKTAGAFRSGGAVRFYLPVFSDGVAAARYRAVARSAALAKLAWAAVQDGGVNPEARGATNSRGGAQLTAAELKSATTWVQAHGVGGVMVFRRYVSDNPNAPEFWAEPGKYVPVNVV